MGPFLGKNLGTTISPWVVTIEALEQFKVANVSQDPKPFPYLVHDDPFNFDIHLTVSIKPNGEEPSVVSNSNFRYLYWTLKQQLAHHSITGCNVCLIVNLSSFKKINIVYAYRFVLVICWLPVLLVVLPPVHMVQC